MAVVALALIAAYLMIGQQGGWEIAWRFRGPRVGAMVVVGVAVACSTVAFQTLAANRILTPAILGFDVLFQSIQTVLMFSLGAITVNQIGRLGLFGISVTIMLAFSLALFWGLFGGAGKSLHLVLLIGLVLGTLLRSLTLMLQQRLDPGDFLVLQSRLFASFHGVDQRLLVVSGMIVTLGALALFALRLRLDVLVLGREISVSLGVNHKRITLTTITIVAVLTSASTALVGPITFFGLLVANLAYALVRDHRHASVLPAAALLAVIALVGGQIVLEHGLGQRTLLSVVIEFLGGIVFIAMLILQGRRFRG
ncbi:MAG: iron chelate uptake ABC transporter family permease subunit [Promicromonosporaceae bacterium]|nr:iron chelate uptake ABC transporter family permease subunit [Promicromonosporaceae bacterium]